MDEGYCLWFSCCLLFVIFSGKNAPKSGLHVFAVSHRTLKSPVTRCGVGENTLQNYSSPLVGGERQESLYLAFSLLIELSFWWDCVFPHAVFTILGMLDLCWDNICHFTEEIVTAKNAEIQLSPLLPSWLSACLFDYHQKALCYHFLT